MDFEDGGYRAKFNMLIGVMSEHGLRSDQAKNYLRRIVEEEGEDFRGLAATVAALKLKFPEARNFEELMQIAERKLGTPFSPPEIHGIDDRLSELYGFKDNIENDTEH